MSAPLLLLGYEAFGAWEHNSTIDVTERSAAILEETGISVRRHIAEVVLDRLSPFLNRLLSEEKVAGILATGLSGRSAEVEVEGRAVNRAHFTFADNDGRMAKDELLIEGAPASLATTLDLDVLSLRLGEAGVAHRLSGDAGTYLCNAMYFHALHRMLPRSLPALFLHLPPLPGAALRALKRNPRAAVGDVSMDLDLQVAAVVAAGRLMTKSAI